jgi:hypothetical protein
MKYIFAFILALALLCLAINTTQAQYRRLNHFPDSIQIEFPDQKAQVIFEFRRFHNDDPFLSSFATWLKEWLDYIQHASPANIHEGEPKRVDIHLKPEGEKLMITSAQGDAYKPAGKKTEITITDNNSQTHVLVRENTIEQLLPPGWELYIHSNDVNVTVYATTFGALEELTKQDFEQVATELNEDPKMKSIGKKRIQSRFILQQGKVSQRIINYIYPGDLIFLTGHAGMGLLQDKFYPELSASVGIYFTDHFNKRNQRLEIIYNNMFFTEKKSEGGYTLNNNSFLSLAYGRNFSNTSTARWTSVGAGLLIHKQGDYFKGKTAKFFFSTDIGSPKLNIVPEFYLTNDFKKFAFGIKLNYTF